MFGTPRLRSAAIHSVVERSRNNLNKRTAMKGFMYILKCADNTYYTGSTIDLQRRLEQHQMGEGANFTRKRRPVELVYFEEYPRIDEAFYREKQVQGWSKKKKEALINGDVAVLHKHAVCRNITHCSTSCLDSARRPVSSTPLGGRFPRLRSAVVHAVVERSRNNRVIPGCFDFAQQPGCMLNNRDACSTTGMHAQQPGKQPGYGINNLSNCLLIYPITCW